MAPWNKDPGPLAKSTKECELLKKKVDALVKECNKVIGNKKLKDKETKLDQLYQNCLDNRKLVDNQNENFENLKEEDEQTKVKNYDQKKTQEVNKLSAMKVILNETLTKLLPDTTEEDFIKKHKQAEDKEDDEVKEKDEKEEEKGNKAGAKPVDDDEEDEEEEDDDEEEEDDEDEEEDDEEEEEEDEEEESKKPSARPTRVPSGAANKHDDEEDDEEEETEEEDDEDEEDDEEEEDEEERPVPAKRGADSRTKKKREEEDDDEKDEDEEEEDDDDDEEDDEEDDDEEDEDEEEDDDRKKLVKGDDKSKKVDTLAKKKKGADKKEEDVEVTQQTLHKFEAIDDYDAEEEGDLMFTKGTVLTVLETREDGWWMAENDAGEKGLVPSTYLQKYNPYEGVQHKDDGDEEDDDDDEQDEDDDDEGMSPRASQRSKKLWGSLRKAVQDTTVSDVLHAMGAVPSGFRKSTLSRKFNEGDQYRLSNYLIPKLSQSNLMYSDLFFEPSTSKIRLRSTRNERVITIVSCQQIPPPGAGVEVEGRHIKMCLFDGQQILSNIHSVTVASVDKSQRSWAFSTRTADNMDPFSHAEVFFRSNNTTSNIGILFELCISYSRVSTSEKGEFSCGWVHLPMFDVNGTATPNKSYDLYVNGGTPYEKGIEVDPAISRRTSSSALASLISGNKQPRLVVKLSQPKQQHKELMDTLPDTVMGATTLLPLYSYYRCCLADSLLRDRLDLDSTELIHSPLLKQFPKIADTPDLMKLFRTSWFEKLKDVRRAEKRDEEYMKEVFRQVFMDSVYPVQHVATLPAYRMGDEDNDKIRQETLVRYNETRRGNKSALATLLSPNMVFHPMILDEVAYSVIGPSCLNKPHSVS